MFEDFLPLAFGIGIGILVSVFSTTYAHYSENRKMKSNMMKGLDVETKRNWEIARLNKVFEMNYKKVNRKKRKKILFVPFHRDVWNAIVSHGMLKAFNKEVLEDLVDTYALIHEVNSIITMQEYPDSICSPIDSHNSEDVSSGTDLSVLTFEKSNQLIGKLSDLRTELGYQQ